MAVRSIPGAKKTIVFLETKFFVDKMRFFVVEMHFNSCKTPFIIDERF